MRVRARVRVRVRVRVRARVRARVRVRVRVRIEALPPPASHDPATQPWQRRYGGDPECPKRKP